MQRDHSRAVPPYAPDAACAAGAAAAARAADVSGSGKETPMSIHDGHRDRMRRQLKTSGMDSLSDVQVLEGSTVQVTAYFYNAKIVVTAVIVLICLFAFVNLLNTCITNTVIRRHDYALLEAAGMTKVQIYQTQSAENRIYFFGSLIGSCVVGIPLGFLLCNKIAEIPGLSYISYRFPWPFLLLYFVLVFVVHIVVTVYQRHILAKQSVVERIKAIE